MAALSLAIGLMLGTAGTIGITQLLRGSVFGVPALGLASLVVLAALLAVLTLAACSVPAIRASRTDPADVLRSE